MSITLGDEEICGSEPPVIKQPWGSYGDCWCTLPPDHPEDLCLCQPCAERFGAPGWKRPTGDHHDQP